jgi:serine protease AprX
VLGPGLLNLALRHPSRRVEVIVQLQAGATPASALRAVHQAGGVVIAQLPIISGFAARMPARAAAGLRSVASVRVVSLNAAIRPTSDGGATSADGAGSGASYDAAVQAPQAWLRGADGQGVGVAVVDTGVAGDLPDFRRSPTSTQSRVIVSAVVNPAAPNATDAYGHGTHVAGIIAGNGWDRGAGDPLDGKYVGVAPAANLISVKADDGAGHTTVLDLIDGLQFVVDHRAQYNIRVVNLSVRSDIAQSYLTDPLDAAVEQAWMKGIVVVTAAGNLGTQGDAVNYAPANDPYVITVGAVDDQGTPGSGDDTVASWSSRGTTQDGFAKPDVLAPGAHIVSTLAPGSAFASICPSCVTDGGYFRAGGTSMAAAVVSGAVADLLTVQPTWTPDQVKGALVNTARPVPNAGGNAGEISVLAALSRYDKVTPPAADQGLTPNEFIDPSTGNINDPTGSWATGSWGTGSWGTGSWATGSWAVASGSFVAPWAQASYTGAPLNPGGFVPVPPDCIQLERANWSTGSWATGSWSAAQLDDALAACRTASGQAGTWGTGSWGTGSWATGSWATGSWGTGSWGTGSWATGSWATGSWSTSFDF